MITFILPVYNTALYLKNCIESLIMQLQDGMEILLIDDGSTDNSPHICDDYSRQYPELIRVIHQKNAGVSAARNAGIKAARTKWLSFIDSDDCVCEDFVKNYIKIIGGGNPDLILSGYKLVDDLGKTLGVYGPNNSGMLLKNNGEIQDLFFGISDNLEARGWLCTYIWNKLYRKDIIVDYGITFDESLGYGEDFIFNAHYYRYVEKIWLVSEPNYMYYKHGSGATSHFWGGERALERRKMVYETNLSMANSLNLGNDYHKGK